ncbi:MFS transporter [Bradyrhizobium sp. 41S5]|uniref:MFS transporter n=1 Tax=Bradyrhizobium sp. 41S5 TaxID=1404443 RepID=UPI00156AFDBE|nr:MFS transporter [Bradyrhizobium sp. 41S5]UFX48267.1 MFS transporter [Bradyrhizobium sp. 41S5]
MDMDIVRRRAVRSPSNGCQEGPGQSPHTTYPPTMISFGLSVTVIAVVKLPHSRHVILPASVLLGGSTSTLYPICVANAHDQMPSDQAVAVSGRLILIDGLGSILGPLIGTTMMAHFTINGPFYVMAALSLLLALIAVTRGLATTSPISQERPFEILTPQATSLAHDLLAHVPTPQKLE